MRGFFATLTDQQKKAALEYDAVENHGSELFMRGPSKTLKTHCKQGHEFTPENTIWSPVPGTKRKRRNCRACKYAWQNASRRQKGSAFRVSRDELRRLVDIVWNEATESTAVPSTKWADQLIDKALAVPNGNQGDAA